MRRLRLDLGYDGTDFRGWAAQPGLRTVQGEIEAALAMASREGATMTVAGRTDAGVHARHQVCHVDISDEAWARLAPRGGESDEGASAPVLTRAFPHSGAATPTGSPTAPSRWGAGTACGSRIPSMWRR